MSAQRFAKKSSFAALAAVLAATLFAAPATARPADPEGERGRGAWNRGGEARGHGEARGRSDARGRPDGASSRGWSRPAPVAVQPPAPAAIPRGEWRRGAEARPVPPVTRQVERRWGGRGDAGTVQNDPSPRFEGRNRSYADPERNRSYRDGDRDRSDWRRDRDRDERRADWRRDGDRQREAWRHDRQRNEHWRGNDWRRDDRHGYNGNHRRWDNRWRNDRRYDWYGYRNSHRHVYRIGRYHAPYRGYYYRPLSIGFTLDSLFFSSRYWINDPWQYRLPDAYGPYRWVRYYDDALLVDIYSGEVVDVIRDFFW